MELPWEAACAHYQLALAGRSAAFFAASVGHASLFFHAAIIALCSERRAVTFNGLARRVFFSLL